MQKIPKISESEWLIMKVLWRHGAMTANEIVDTLINMSTWKDKTVKTLINRLVKKGAVGFHKKGREYVYHSLVNEKDCIRGESRSFLKRVFGGAIKPMLVTLVENEDLSLEDVEELKRMIQEKKKRTP